MRVPVILCAAAATLIAGTTAGLAVNTPTAVLAAARQVTAAAFAATAPEGTIPEVAAGAGKFATLLAAVKAAGLADAISGPGPFTVFAPTDEAFKALGSDRVETLLKPENRERLTDILKYHVVSGRYSAGDFAKFAQVTTLDGQRITPSVDDGQLRVNKTRIIATDIAASNGVIHVIDRVLIPAKDTIPATAEAAGHFKTLVAAVGAAGLADALSGPGPFTVLAPTDDAFAKLPKGTVESLLRPENRNQLQQILKLHVVPARVYARDAIGASTAPTLAGQDLAVSTADGRITVTAGNSARVVKTDIDASNGVIHVIDAVLLPQGAGAMMSDAAEAGAAGILRLAVSRGVPLFNNGNPAGCAAVYEVACSAVIALPKSGTTPAARDALRKGLDRAAAAGSDSDRAWALREGIDEALRSLDNAAERIDN